MNQDGQIYFAPEDEIPQEDVERLRAAAARDFEERLERLEIAQSASQPGPERAEILRKRYK